MTEFHAGADDDEAVVAGVEGVVGDQDGDLVHSGVFWNLVIKVFFPL